MTPDDAIRERITKLTDGVPVTEPAWIPCPEGCGEFWCRIHEQHACECDCPPIEEWECNPYVTGGPPLKRRGPGAGTFALVGVECVTQKHLREDVSRRFHQLLERTQPLEAFSEMELLPEREAPWKVLRSVPESEAWNSASRSSSPITDASPPSNTTEQPLSGSAGDSRRRESSKRLWDSMADPSTASWIASLQASRANRIPWPGHAAAPETNDGSGPISPVSSERIRPGLCFLENVAGILHDAGGDSPREDLEDSPDESMGGMGSVLRDLAEMGFVAAWGSVRASDVGASHIRERVFILADTTGTHRRSRISEEEAGTGQEQIGWFGPASGDGTLAVTGLARLPRCQPEALPATQADPEGRATAELRAALLETFAPGPLDPAWSTIIKSHPHLAPSLSPITATLARAVSLEKSGIDLHEEAESGFHRLAHGLAYRLVERRSRLRFAGNGVVPLQAAYAFALLRQKLQLATH